MELFLLSNAIVTTLAILYDRYSRASISSKLIVSSFALLCWIIPFSLIRDILPQEVAVNVHWVVPQVSESILFQTISIENPGSSTELSFNSISNLFSLTQLFILLCTIGLLILSIRVFQHFAWLKNEDITHKQKY